MGGTARKYLSAVKGLKWCKGCGHWRVLASLARALERLDLPNNKIVIVTDIGCVGLSDRFFNTNAFHGLHGRSVTYATGIKLARPELTIIVLMGDGGCGIGGTHIVNAARRNVGITLIVANNFNYGMTGCQQSVTTPEGGRTATSPCGNIEMPLDVCGLGRAGGAGWVGRITATRENSDELEKMIHDAVAHEGFSMLDIWETCPGGYEKRNELGEAGLERTMMECGFEGGMECKYRPEFSHDYRKRIIGSREGEPISRVDLTPIHSSELDRAVRIVIAGSAGQAIQSASTIFGAGAILSGLHATQRNTYPITRQSGHSIAETVIGPQRIEYAGIGSPDHLLVLSREGLKEVEGEIGKMDAACSIICTEDLKGKLPETGASARSIPGHAKMGLEKQSTVMAALASLLVDIAIYPVEALREGCRRMGAGTYLEENLAAIEKGLELR